MDVPENDLNQRHGLELRRGALTLAVLAALRQEEYGYSLRKKLLEAGLDIEEGTLYPLIRRLESQGLLQSEWRDGDNRQRRYYQISDSGQLLLQELRNHWNQLHTCLQQLMEES